MKKLSLEVLSLILYSSSALAWNTSVPAGTTVTGGNVSYGENQSVYGTTINQTVSGTQNIKAGGLSENSTIYDYALQDVEAGGKAIGTHILMRGQQDVNGTAENSIVDKYASMYVRSGGKATGTEVNGGTFNVYAGGAIENTNLNSGTQALYGTSQNMTIGNGGTQNVNASGTATNTTINSGGRQNVAKGGTATETIINGGRQYVYGTANKTTLESGRLTAYSGSTLNDTTINDGSVEISQANINGLTINNGSIKAYSGAKIDNATMLGGTLTVYSGGNINNSTINGGTQTLYGTATATTINKGGTQNVNSGGTANSTTITAGGIQNIAEGGQATQTTINNGKQSIYGMAKDTVINNGGTQIVNSAGMADNTTINAGGIQNIDAEGNAVTTTIEGGVQNVYGTATNTILNSGTVYAYDGSTLNNTTVNNGNMNIEQANIDGLKLNNGNVTANNGAQISNAQMSGGILTVNTGGEISNSTINGGTQVINGIAQNTIINTDGIQNVYGTSTATTINGGTQNVYGSATSTIINSGIQNVYSSNTATDTLINAGGIQNVAQNGHSVSTTINGGTQNVYGAATDTILNSGELYAYDGSTLNNTTVNNGNMNIKQANIDGLKLNNGNIIANNGAQIDNTQMSGGTLTVNTGGKISNSTINGGTQNIYGSSATTTINNGIQNIYGTAIATNINGGTQNVYGEATETTLNSGMLYAHEDSILNNTTINNGNMNINKATINGLTVKGGNINADNTSQVNGLKMYGGSGVFYSSALLSGDITVNNAEITLHNGQNLNNVEMDKGTIRMANNGDSQTLNIQTLNGSGKFYLTSAVTEGHLDQIEIGSGNGKFGLQLHDYSSGSDLPRTIKLVTTSDNDEQFYLVGGATDIGAYQYTLQHQGEEWFLQRSLKLTESAMIAKNTYSTVSTIFYTHLNTLNRRLGDVRFNKENGLWIRGFGNEIKISHKDDTETKINMYGTQFGYDYILPQTFVSKWLVGVFAGTSTTKDKFTHEGHADINSYSTGLYTTLLSQKGYYLDLVGTYYHSRQKLTTYTPDGMPVKGKYNLDAWSVSAEIGKRITLPDDYFLEPQIQVAYMDLGNISYRTNFNTLVKGSNFNVLNSRIGLRGGKRISQNFEAFIQADLLHDFDHKSTIDIADLTIQEDIASTRWRLGGGFSADFSDSASSYFNISTTLDNKVEVPIDINLGFRYEF